MPPYVPLIVVSLSVTVKVNATCLSAARSDTTVFVTFRLPVSWTFATTMTLTPSTTSTLAGDSVVTVAVPSLFLVTVKGIGSVIGS